MELRYYPPEKQGLRLAGLLDGHQQVFELRYYPPEKQGLRQILHRSQCRCTPTQILSSRKTRIKTVPTRLPRAGT